MLKKVTSEHTKNKKNTQTNNSFQSKCKQLVCILHIKIFTKVVQFYPENVFKFIFCWRLQNEICPQNDFSHTENDI